MYLIHKDGESRLVGGHTFLARCWAHCGSWFDHLGRSMHATPAFPDLVSLTVAPYYVLATPISYAAMVGSLNAPTLTK